MKLICCEPLKKQAVSHPEYSQRLLVGTINEDLLLLIDLPFTPLGFSLWLSIDMHRVISVNWSRNLYLYSCFLLLRKFWHCLFLDKMDYDRNFLSSRHFMWLINLVWWCLFMALIWKALNCCCNEFILFLSTANEAMAVLILKHISTLNYGLDYYHPQPAWRYSLLHNIHFSGLCC